MRVYVIEDFDTVADKYVIRGAVSARHPEEAIARYTAQLRGGTVWPLHPIAVHVRPVEPTP